MKRFNGKRAAEDPERVKDPITSEEGAKNPEKRKKKILRIVLGVSLSLVGVCGVLLIAGFAWYGKLASEAGFDPALLPTANAVATVMDAHGNEIGYADEELIPPEDIPKHVRDAFVSLEDRRFYSHKGYDPIAIVRALFADIKAGKIVEGASTITQQLVKNTHLSSERTLERKLKEIALAREIEKRYSKDEILSMYLSVIYFGAGAYGINAASETYFGCKPSDLSLSQAATLAGVLKNPSRYSPQNDIALATERRNAVLDVMYSEGCISEGERDRAKAEKLEICGRERSADFISFYVKAALKEAAALLGVTEYRLHNSGVTVMTAMDPERQKAVFEETSDRSNYSAGSVEGAAALVDNATGEITAYYCTLGYDIARQAGSVMKPLAVYAPALDLGAVTLATPIRDEKTDFGGWSPENFGGIYYGDTHPREAMMRSMNTAAVKVLSYVGVERALSYCMKLGLPVGDADANLALALGATSRGTDPCTLAGAYSTLAREGNFIKPHFVRAIVRDGMKVATADIRAKQVFSPAASALVTDCLADTVRSGTAKTLSSLPFEVAGKTGTVQTANEKNSDAWCVSYTSEHTLAVWHGADAMNELGGGHPTHHAADIWRRLYGGELPADHMLPASVVRKDVDVYSTTKNRKATLAVASTPEKYKRSELFDKRFIPSSQGSRFVSSVPRFTLSAADGTVTVMLLAEPPFEYSVICEDALGRRLIAICSAENGCVRFADTVNCAGETPEDVSGYDDTRFTLTHRPFSFGGKVTYTVEMRAEGENVNTGASDAECFP